MGRVRRGGGGGGGGGGRKGGRGHVDDTGEDSMSPAQELAKVIGGVGSEAAGDATGSEKEDDLVVQVFEL